MIEMVKNFGDRVWRAIKKPELVFAIILLSVFSALSIGHEGLRLVKLLVLYLPTVERCVQKMEIRLGSARPSFGL